MCLHCRRLRHGGGSYSAADGLITTPPRQPPPLALRRHTSALLSPPADEQPGGAGRAPRGSFADGGAGASGVQMGFSSDWDPSAVLVCPDEGLTFTLTMTRINPACIPFPDHANSYKTRMYCNASRLIVYALQRPLRQGGG